MQQTLAEAIDTLKHNNLKITKQRRALLEYLLAHQDHYHEVTLVDEYMRGLFPGMSHNTIYRNLKEFEDAGMVEQRVQSGQGEVKYQCDVNHIHHHHFICENCGMVQELEACPMDSFQTQLPGCKIDTHRFEIYGLCADCNRKLTEQSQ